MARSIDEKIKIVNNAVPALNPVLLRRTVVVVEYGDQGPVDHGTGILLKIGGDHLVVTAAHVIKGKAITKLQLVATDSPSNLLLEPSEGDMMGGELNEELDIGFLRIKPEVVDRLKGREFISLEDLDIFPVNLSSDLIFFFGMAETQHGLEGGNVHSYGSFTYLDTVDVDYDWTQPGHRPLLLEFPYPETVTNSFTLQETLLPDPYGMSGGGLWRVSFSGGGVWHPDPKLVGVATEFFPNTQTVKANRLESLMHLLALHFPEADAFLNAKIAGLESASVDEKCQ